MIEDLILIFVGSLVLFLAQSIYGWSQEPEKIAKSLEEYKCPPLIEKNTPEYYRFRHEQGYHKRVAPEIKRQLFQAKLRKWLVALVYVELIAALLLLR